MGVPDTPANSRDVFVERVREKLHMVLAFSPVGDALRVRCRAFPSLINCCTIDWYSSWPKDALMSVSEHFLEVRARRHWCSSAQSPSPPSPPLPPQNLELPSPDVRHGLSLMCSIIHTSVNAYAERFYQELQRRVRRALGIISMLSLPCA